MKKFNKLCCENILVYFWKSKLFCIGLDVKGYERYIVYTSINACTHHTNYVQKTKIWYYDIMFCLIKNL